MERCTSTPFPICDHSPNVCSSQAVESVLTVISCENLSPFPVLSPSADPGREGSSGRCWGGRLGSVHLRHQCRGHDPRGGTKQDQSSNRLPHPHPQQVSHLAMHDATKDSVITHFPFYLGQIQRHKSPQTIPAFILTRER